MVTQNLEVDSGLANSPMARAFGIYDNSVAITHYKLGQRKDVGLTRSAEILSVETQEPKSPGNRSLEGFTRISIAAEFRQIGNYVRKPKSKSSAMLCVNVSIVLLI